MYYSRLKFYTHGRKLFKGNVIFIVLSLFQLNGIVQNVI